MDSVTQTVLAGTQQVANAIGGAADARERRRARARQAWDRLAENTGKFASWVDEKAYETDAQSISDAVAAASIGGDYEKALQALANTPTKTAKGAADKLKAAMTIRRSMDDVQAQREESLLAFEKVNLGRAELKAKQDQEAWEKQVAEAEARAFKTAMTPRKKIVGVPFMYGSLPTEQMVAPTPQEAAASYSQQPGANPDIAVKLAQLGSLDMDRREAAAHARRTQMETERKNREDEDRKRADLERKTKMDAITVREKIANYTRGIHQDAIENGFREREIMVKEGNLENDFARTKAMSDQFNKRLEFDLNNIQAASELATQHAALVRMSEQMSQLIYALPTHELREQMYNEFYETRVQPLVEAAKKIREKQAKKAEAIIKGQGGEVKDAPAQNAGDDDDAAVWKTFDPEFKKLLVKLARTSAEPE